MFIIKNFKLMFLAFHILFILLISFEIVTTITINKTNYNDSDNAIEDEKDDKYSFLVIGGYRPEKHILAKYIVSLRGYINDRLQHYCGGSIITPKVILTAAHCIVDEKMRLLFPKIIVVAGSPFILKQPDSMRTYVAVKALYHPMYYYYTSRSDLALVHLDEEIDLDSNTRSIVPLRDTKPKAGMECVSFGWGKIFPGGPAVMELVYVNLTIQRPTRCSEYYEQMSTDVICAADLMDKEKGVWKGDSGGPLICEGKLTGIISFGFELEEAPSYFANVYQHRKWILANFGNRIYLSICSLLFEFIVAN